MLLEYYKQYMIDDDDYNDDFLCCCEYFNVKNRRSHILECCCDCEDVDEYFERKLTRTTLPVDIYSNMYKTIQDRCRIPWKGGARIIQLDVILPVIIIPMLALIASINSWFTFAVFLALPFIVCYFMKFYQNYNQSTKFFFSWTVASSVLLFLVFEYLVVPQLEILPEENWFLLAFSFLSILFIYFTRKNNVKCIGEYFENDNMDECCSTEKYCKICRMKQPLKSVHCNICGFCTVVSEYHCSWLNCCIGGKNRKTFMLSLLFSIISLFYFSYLTLTTVCHPFLFYDYILIPNDCSDVFFDLGMALCFVSGAYSLLCSALILLVLIRHCWLILLGKTHSEWNDLSRNDKKFCGLKLLFMKAIYHKELISV